MADQNFAPTESVESSDRAAGAGLSNSADLTSPQSNDHISEMEKSTVKSSQDTINSWNNVSIDFGKGGEGTAKSGSEANKDGKGNEGKSNEGKDNDSKGKEQCANDAKGNDGKGNETKCNDGKGNDAKDKEGQAKETKGNDGKANEAKDNDGKEKDNKGKEAKPQEHISDNAACGGSAGIGGKPSVGSALGAAEAHRAAADAQKSGHPTDAQKHGHSRVFHSRRR